MVRFSDGAQTKYYTYVHNLQGDVVGILDNTGALVVEYKYDAWGKPLSTTGTLATTLGVENPLRYRGYGYDEETGYYYLRSRYYDPGLRRFVNADDYLRNASRLFGLNIYTYCDNKPVLCADYDGHTGKVVIGAGFNTVHDYSYKDIADAVVLLNKLKKGIKTWQHRYQRFTEKKPAAQIGTMVIDTHTTQSGPMWYTLETKKLYIPYTDVAMYMLLRADAENEAAKKALIHMMPYNIAMSEMINTIILDLFSNYIELKDEGGIVDLALSSIHNRTGLIIIETSMESNYPNWNYSDLIYEEWVSYPKIP